MSGIDPGDEYISMKNLIGIWLMSICVQAVSAQYPQLPADSILLYFAQTQEATRACFSLWNKDLYGPIMLVDSDTRELFANVRDRKHSLTPSEGLYKGLLPEEIPVSNTNVEWGGLQWAMITLPLPHNRFDRVELMTHELFHCAQSSLGFHFQREENSHLDRREGRIYLRLELEALYQALSAGRYTRSVEHLQNALLFRKYRHQLYRGSETAENQLELLEGLATYTGQMMSGRDKWQWRDYLMARLQAFGKNRSFVRTFAYETIPVYGFFLYQKENQWNKRVDSDTDLTEFFVEAFHMDKRILLQSYVKQVAEEYNGRKIADEELKRELSNNARQDIYREKFLNEPHLEIRLEEMDLSYDLDGVFPLDEDEGTVYLSLQISDRWGVLHVDKGGALMRSDWRWVIVSRPLEIDGNRVTGEGWTLNMKDGYYIEETAGGVYLISRK